MMGEDKKILHDQGFFCFESGKIDFLKKAREN